MALTQVKTLGIADDAVTGAKIADDTVAEANMANDAISLTELKAGTDGQIISWDASGNPVAIGPGTDGQVLTSTGSGSPPAFEAVPAGGATINNATANEIVTVASTTTQLDAEANLTFDGTNLVLGGGSERTDLYVAGGAAFQIEGTSSATNSMSITCNRADSAPAELHLAKTRSASLGGNTIVQDGDAIGTIYFSAADGTNVGSNVARMTAAVDGTPGANDTPGRLEFCTTADGAEQPVERVRIDSAGNMKITDGNLIMGTAGHGIDFSATAQGGSGNTNNELLADYEEGVWTPTVSVPTGSGSLGSNNCARYQKVGNAVHIYGFFKIDWSNDAAGDITLGNLPYATANLTDGVGGGTCLAYGSHNVTHNYMKFCITNLTQNATTLKLWKQVDIDSVEHVEVVDVNWTNNNATVFYGFNLNYLTMPGGLWY